jgi:hypothetical protein
MLQMPVRKFQNRAPGQQKNAIEKSQIVLNSHLVARATHTYYFAILLPSLSYSLPVSHFSSKNLDDVDKKIAVL